MGFLIKKVKDQIVTAKITLREDDLKATGSIYNIPEYPAVKGYFWNVLTMNGEIIEDVGNTPYVGTTNIHIQSENSLNYQLRFGASYMSQPVGYWHTTIVTTILPTIYTPFDQLQIHNTGALTVGDTSLVIYIGAILQKY
jgi:hypothetical protein